MRRVSVQFSRPDGLKGMHAMEIDIPEVKAELEAAFARYETALVTNDVEALDELFHAAPTTIRYGGGENL